MRLSNAAVACTVFVLETSCAYQDATVRGPAHGTVTTGYRIAGLPAVVLAMPLVDERPQRNRCGIKKVGSRESASVRCDDDPSRWLAQLFAQELRAAGFRVYDEEAPPGQPSVRISGFLSQLFIEPDVESRYYVLSSSSYYIPEADIAVRLVARGAHFEAERRFYFKAAGDYNGGALESNFQLALDNSVKESLRGMVSAVGELVNLAPRLEAQACTGPRDVSAQK